MKRDRMFPVGFPIGIILCWILGILCNAALIGGAIYIAIHFLKKVW